jgi:hypothetical protein
LQNARCNEDQQLCLAIVFVLVAEEVSDERNIAKKRNLLDIIT